MDMIEIIAWRSGLNERYYTNAMQLQKVSSRALKENSKGADMTYLPKDGEVLKKINKERDGGRISSNLHKS